MPSKLQRRRRIGIDARFYGPVGKGLGRYTQEIVDRITAADQANDYVVFLGADNFHSFLGAANVTKVLADIPWYGWAEQYSLPRLIASQQLDLMHFPHFNVPIFCTTPFVVTIHDLILFHFPTKRGSTLHPLIYAFKNLAYRQVIKSAVRRAKQIITVSDFTKRDLVESLGIVEAKITVTYEGVAALTKAGGSQQSLTQLGITDPYWLYVGNAYPHKNLENLLEVFAKFRQRRPNYKLVLVGRNDYFYHRLKNMAARLRLWHGDGAANNAVLFPGYVTDRTLANLYAGCLAYIFPSLYEGFGLPPLEAMSAGAPVLSARAASLPEILGNAAAYFDPKDQVGWLEAMLAISDDQRQRQALIAKGYERIKLFDWQKCAEETLKIYQQIC